MGVIVPLISVFVRTVKTLVVFAIVPLRVSCEVTFVEEGFATEDVCTSVDLSV